MTLLVLMLSLGIHFHILPFTLKVKRKTLSYYAFCLAFLVKVWQQNTILLELTVAIYQLTTILVSLINMGTILGHGNHNPFNIGPTFHHENPSKWVDFLNKYSVILEIGSPGA